MALITCPECGREISEFAITCPWCGCPNSLFAKGASAEASAEPPTYVNSLNEAVLALKEATAAINRIGDTFIETLRPKETISTTLNGDGRVDLKEAVTAFVSPPSAPVPKRESFTERKARYEVERAARAAAEAVADAVEEKVVDAAAAVVEAKDEVVEDANAVIAAAAAKVAEVAAAAQAAVEKVDGAIQE